LIAESFRATPTQSPSQPNQQEESAMRRLPHIAASLVLSFLVAGPAGAVERETVGSVDQVEKRAEAVYGEAARRLDGGAGVLFEDLLRTGSGARLKATLLDGSEITMGEHASLMVDSLIYAPARSTGELSLRVVEGAFQFVSGQISKLSGGTTTITTQVGTLGIRGTKVWGGSIDGGFGILALEGIVTVNARGGQVTLNPGEGTMFSSIDAAPEAPRRWPEAKIARAAATVAFSQ